MKKKKYVFGIVGLIVLVLVIFVFTMFQKMGKELKNLNNVEIDMNQVADGSYTASTETMLVKAQVRVTVKDHKIETIELLKHECGKGKPAEVIVDDMVSNNTYVTDTVSGATASSKVIQNAVNKALQKGLDK